MLLATVQSELDRLAVGPGRLLVAVSGGRDSMVLLDVSCRVAGALDLELVVGHVDHGLRGDESDRDAEFVRAAAVRAGLPYAIRRVSPESERQGSSSRERPTLEEAARNLRRAALESIAEEHGCRWIATAHHAADQAETVLLRLLRGTALDGLAGMAPQSADGRWIRPLLRVAAEAIGGWAVDHDVVWQEDASNLDRRFARNRLRHDWIPGLAATFNPQLLRAVSDLAEAGRRDLEWIEGLVDEAARERIQHVPEGVRFAIDDWATLPEALARRLVRRGLVDVGLGRDVTRPHLERVLAFLCRGREAGRDKRLELPRGMVLRREGDGFLLSADSGRNEIGEDDNARVLGRD